MRKILFALFITISCSTFAQKNLITVPIAKVVQKERVTVQPGFTINKNLMQMGNILTFGLGGNFQAGLTLTDVTFNFGPEETFFPIEKVQPGMNPDLLINLQKGFKINNKTWIGLGTLTGANIAEEGTNLSMFNYLNAQTEVFGKNIIVLGAYHGEATRLVTEEGKFGIMAGFQVPVSQKWTLLGDYISGDHARSYINTGFSFKINSAWNIFSGVAMPAPESGNKYSGILQLSYTSK